MYLNLSLLHLFAANLWHFIVEVSVPYRVIFVAYLWLITMHTTLFLNLNNFNLLCKWQFNLEKVCIAQPEF